MQANKLREKERDNSILNAGYEVLHIKESDYREDPEREIKKCIDFIYAI